MMPDRSFAALATSAATVVLLVAGLAACTPAGGDGGASDPSGASDAPGATKAAVSADDVRFVAMMAAHHDQAVALATLADGRAADPAIAALAGTIALTQRAEADRLRDWLDRRGIDASDPAHEAEHDAAEMPGALSSTTLDEAARLTGPAFDRLFVDAMTRHHEGAVEMAEARLAASGDPSVARLARTIATSQAIELDRLRDLAPPTG